jgi:hypothetical protein
MAPTISIQGDIMAKWHAGMRAARNGLLWIMSFAMCLAVAACSSASSGIALAKEGVGQFHQQLDSEQYDVLYTAADAKLHGMTSKSDFTKLLTAVHRKLGAVQQANLRNTGISWYAGQGETVTLVYETTFTSGSGTEQFVWHITGNEAKLYGYHINSNDLITN